MECETFFPPAVVGGLIVGIFALAGVFLTRILESWRRYNIITGVLRALYEELNVISAQLDSEMLKGLWDKYEAKKEFWDKIGNEKKFWEEWENSKNEDKAIFSYYFPVSVNFSIIYRSNSNLIGGIANSELERLLVWNYSFLQMLIECYERNNRLFDQYLKAKMSGEEKLIDMSLRELYLLAPILKGNHDTVNESMGDLMETLKEEIDRRKFWSCKFCNGNAQFPILQSSSPTTQQPL